MESKKIFEGDYLDIWTPKFWRSDAIAAKIREKDQAEYEKDKAKTEKRVPIGSE